VTEVTHVQAVLWSVFDSTSEENLCDIVHTYVFRKYDIANENVLWDDALR